MTEVAEKLSCSFCGQGQDDVEKLVAGPGVYICNVCVDLCNEVIAVNGPLTLLHELAEQADDDLVAILVRVRTSQSGVEKAIQGVVRELRARGVPWARIGDALGIARQSAWERFSGED